MKLHLNLLTAVADALFAVFEKNLYADRVLERLLKSNPRWGARDRAFIAENTYNIVRYWRQIEEHLPKNTPRNYLHAVGIWLIIKGLEIPNRPEFSDLRRSEILEKHRLMSENLLYRESLPDELYAIVEKELGEKAAEIFEEMNKPAELFIRVNSLKTNHEALREQFLKEGVHSEFLHDDVFLLKEKINVFKLNSFSEGFFEIQDAHSQEIAKFAEIAQGMRVVDACAGAGGKTLHLAALMQNKGRIVALDTEAWKLDELKRRARRAGAGIIETRPIESQKVIKRLYDSADRLLLDVPCSGLGVLKRNPDAKWKIDKDFIDRVKSMQAEILQNYSKICKKGGKLVYATCSILPSENEEQVGNFLTKNPEFSLLKQQTLYPGKLGDGFFMALLERK